MNKLYKAFGHSLIAMTIIANCCACTDSQPVEINNYYITNSEGNVESTVSEVSMPEVSSAVSSAVSKTESKANNSTTATDSNLIVGINYTVKGTTNYLALRNAPAYDGNNEIAKMKNGDELTVQSQNVYGDKGEYCYVTALSGSAKGQSGYVNKSYITPSAEKTTSVAQSSNPKNTDSKAVSQQETVSSNNEQSTDYVAMLREYAESGAWKSDCTPTTEIGSPSSCNNLSYKIFDLDGDGVPEMLIYATAPELSGPKVMSASSFCVISGKEVKTIDSGSTSGGTIGGTTVGLCEEKSTGRLMIYKNSYTGGFGGNASDYIFYSYYNGSLTQEVVTHQISYMDTSLGSDEYTINGANSSIEEISAKIGEYEFISDQNIPSKITTY